MYQTLYHGTPSNRFQEMLKSGTIEVSAKVRGTYIVDKYYSTKTLYLSNAKNSMKLTIEQLLDHEQNGLYKLDANLQTRMDEVHDEVELNIINTSDLKGRHLSKARWGIYSKTELSIAVNEGNPSNHIIYLANKEKATLYARCFLVKSRGLEFDQYLDNPNLNFGVLLELSVPQQKLAPDLNDSRPTHNNTPAWRQTMEDIGQCVYNGALDLSAIKSVTFILPESMSTKAYTNSNIQFNQRYTLEEAKNLVTRLNPTSKMLENIRFRESLLNDK
jgi:hypothetical protein